MNLTDPKSIFIIQPEKNKAFSVISLEMSYLVVLNLQNINKIFSLIKMEFLLSFNAIIFFQ